jgi:hypothetical protein
VPKHVSMTWAQRFKRVFAIDIERCRRYATDTPGWPKTMKGALTARAEEYHGPLKPFVTKRLDAATVRSVQYRVERSSTQPAPSRRALRKEPAVATELA